MRFWRLVHAEVAEFSAEYAEGFVTLCALCVETQRTLRETLDAEVHAESAEFSAEYAEEK